MESDGFAGVEAFARKELGLPDWLVSLVSGVIEEGELNDVVGLSSSGSSGKNRPINMGL